MIKLAITGNIAGGKSLIESFLKENGVLTIDTDEIVHNLLSKDKTIIKKIISIMDNDILSENGKIDRKKLGKIVFEDKNKLLELEKILHPEVKKIVNSFFENNKNEKIIAVAVPQLYETGWENMFDKVLLVAADDKIRLERLMKRNCLSETDAKKRLSAQMPQEEKIKKADFVINNSGDIKDTRLQIKEILEDLLRNNT